jgi:hypothetical protein
MHMNFPCPLRLAVLILFAWTIVPDAHSESRMFHSPTHQGYRLDYRKGSGRECGERVATEWCVAWGL